MSKFALDKLIPLGTIQRRQRQKKESKHIRLTHSNCLLQ